MVFRRATVDDAEQLLSLWHASGASMKPSDNVESVRTVLRHPAAVLLVADSGAEIIGTLLGTFDGWRGHMYRLVVHRDHRRQGIGLRLVREMEQVFLAWGVQRVIALVEAESPWAMQFWTSAAYVRRDDNLVYVVGLEAADAGGHRGEGRSPAQGIA